MKVTELIAKYKPFVLNTPPYGCVSQQSLNKLEEWLNGYAGESGELEDPTGALVSAAVALQLSGSRIAPVKAYALIDCLYSCEEILHNDTACGALRGAPLWFENLYNGYPGCYVWTMAEVYQLREYGRESFAERYGAHRSWEEINSRSLETFPVWFPHRLSTTYSRPVYPTAEMRLKYDLNPGYFYSANEETKAKKELNSCLKN